MTLTRRETVRIVAVLGVLLGLMVLCVPCGFPVAPVQLVFYLCLGWVLFLRRTLPEIDVDWTNVGFHVAALVLFAVGLHGFLRWLRRARSETTAAEWPLKRSVAAAMLAATLFVAGMSGVGLVHQFVWMFGDSKPLLEYTGSAGLRSMSSNNLHQIGIGAHNYADVYSALPPGGIRDERGRMLHGWHTLMLPFVEQRPMYDQIKLDEPWTSAGNSPNFKRVIHGYISPSRGYPELWDENGFAVSHYTGNVLVMGGDRCQKFQDIKDGTSNTMLAGEAVDNPLAWGFPAHWRDPRLGINVSAQGFGGWDKEGGATFVFADASTRFLSKDIDPRVLEAISTPAGREPIPMNDF